MFKIINQFLKKKVAKNPEKFNINQQKKGQFDNQSANNLETQKPNEPKGLNPLNFDLKLLNIFLLD